MVTPEAEGRYEACPPFTVGIGPVHGFGNGILQPIFSRPDILPVPGAPDFETQKTVMSLDSFGRFLRAIGEDSQLSNRFAEALHDREAPEAYAIVADFAARNGFDVSIDEAAAAHQRYVAMFEHEGELSDDLLGDVAGGLSGGARGIDWAAQYMHDVSETAQHLGASLFRNW